MHTEWVKIQVFVPPSHVDKVMAAISQTGVNRLGNYDHCFFVSKGEGYFRALEGADPVVGNIGEVTRVEELKVEFVCPQDKIQLVKDAVKQSHPYEVAPLDVFPLLENPSV